MKKCMIAASVLVLLISHNVTAGTDSAPGKKAESPARPDLSSPEKYFKAITAIPASLSDEEAITLFYAADAAKALVEFDRAGSAGIRQLALFKDAFRKRFPERIIEEEANRIKVAAKWPQRKFETMSAAWSLNATLIGPQLRALKPENCSLVSAREEGGVVKATVKMAGRDKTMDLVREGADLKLTVDATELVKIKKINTVLARCTALLGNFCLELDKGAVTDQNYEAAITRWEKEYMAVINASQ